MHPTAIVDFAPARLVFGTPREVIVARTLDDVVPAVRRAERAALDGAWVVGMLVYESAPAFDDALVVPRAVLANDGPGPLPLAWFAVFDAPLPPSLASVATDVDLTPVTWTADTSRDEWDRDIAVIR